MVKMVPMEEVYGVLVKVGVGRKRKRIKKTNNGNIRVFKFFSRGTKIDDKSQHDHPSVYQAHLVDW